MKIERAVRTDERIGVQDEGSFKIKTSSELFELLSSGLYTNKILAVIRELSCNAWDAQKDCGKELVPFRVHLPNDLEPYFTIRDYGTGLSHKDILELYTTYGESTKNNSNLFIGALGVGSKSPFAYGDSFTVTSFFNGERRSYTAFLSAEGVPSIAMMGNPVSTDQENGLEISLPVNSEDFSSFQKNAEEVLKRFDPVPQVLGGYRKFEIDNRTPKLSGKGWRLYGTNFRQYAFAIQGKIAYPIDTQSMGSIPETVRQFLEFDIEFDFDIGDLDIAASREGLGYKPRTVTAIVSRAKKVIDEIQKNLQDQIEACGTFWEASRLNADFCGHGQIGRRLGLTLTYKNQPLQNTLTVNTDEFPDIEFAEVRLTGYKNLKNTIQRHKISVDFSTVSFFILDDVRKNIWTRVREALKSGVVKNGYQVLLLRPSEDCTDNDLNALQDKLGNPPIIKVSDLPEPPKQEKTTDTTIGYTRVLSGKISQDRENWKKADIDFDEGGYYVEVNNYRTIGLDGKRFYREYEKYYSSPKTLDLNELVYFLIEHQELPEDVTIFGIKSKKINDVKKNPDWINLFDFAIEAVARIAKSNKITEAFVAKDTIDAIAKSLPAWITEVNSSVIPSIGYDRLSEFYRKFLLTKELADTTKNKTNSQIMNIVNQLNIKLKTTNSSIELEEELAELKLKMPIIDYIVYRRYYHEQTLFVEAMKKICKDLN